MWRSLPILIALACHAHAGPCDGLDKYDAAVAAADKATQAHYNDALAKLKITAAPLAYAEWEQDRYRPRKGPDTNVVAELEYNGKKAQYILVGTSECAPDVDFVQDGTKVFRVARSPKPGKVVKMNVCSCGPNVHPGPCAGGMVPPLMLRGYELPAGTTFAGEKRIEYVADRVDATFTGGRCAPPP